VWKKGSHEPKKKKRKNGKNQLFGGKKGNGHPSRFYREKEEGLIGTAEQPRRTSGWLGGSSYSNETRKKGVEGEEWGSRRKRRGGRTLALGSRGRRSTSFNRVWGTVGT